MEKLWQGRTVGVLNAAADSFNSSARFDKRLYRQDIIGSQAHAKMLFKQGIITSDECAAILSGLESILSDLSSGKLEVPDGAEDIHMFVEQVLTERIGEAGKKLHTARSRNDQVTTDLRLYLKGECAEVEGLLRSLLRAICDVAKVNTDAVMPGYTHLQRAQPILFSHQLLAYSEMFRRDISRLNDAAARMDVSPIGCCALAGTTYHIDRRYEAELLGFADVSRNSIDGVSDRDYCAELLFVFSLIMTHLSRFSEELILFSSWEFGFISLDDGFTTGSSIMPQKKNPDMAELVRGKTGRVYGDLVAMLTALKGLPLAYNKDMQEDKEAVFDALDTVKAALSVFAPMVASMRVNKTNMLKAARGGFINATDLADYLVKKGEAFRTAYKKVGEAVGFCTQNGRCLEELTLDEFKCISPLIEQDVYGEISLETCVNKRFSEGGTAVGSVEKQIENLEEFLK